MDGDRLLFSLEEYFDLKRDLRDANSEALLQARERVQLCLEEYVRNHFHKLFLEENRRRLSSTRKMIAVQSPDNHLNWENVVKLLDALNAAPVPSKELSVWMAAYKEWYQNKRITAVNSINPKLELDLENDLDQKW